MKWIPLALLLLLSGQLAAQSNPEFVYTFALDQTSCGLSPANRNRLETKVLQLFSNYGYAANNSDLNPIAVVPRLEVVESRQHQGLQTMTFLVCELTLLARNRRTGTVYGNYSQTLEGSAPSQERALNAVINSMATTGPQAEAFTGKLSRKINDFYAQECAGIIEEANAKAAVREYGDALALLNNVPRQTSCYHQGLTAARDIYTEFERGQIDKIVLQIKHLMAINEYAEIEQLLDQIKAGAPQALTDALLPLLDDLESEVNEAELLKRQWISKQMQAGRGLNSIGQLINSFNLMMGIKMAY